LVETEAGVESALAPLVEMDPALAESLLEALAREAGLVLGPARSPGLRAFLQRARSGQQMALAQGFKASVAFGRLRIHRPSGGPLPAPAVWGSGPHGRVEWGAWEVAWDEEAAGAVRRTGWVTWVERGAGVVRARQPGDRLLPLGGVGHRAVRRLLMEAKVPCWERAGYPVLVRGSEVLWVPGVCRSAQAAPAPGAPALRVEVRPRRGVGGEEAVG
jgi:tRNA(Ile)-lysidine synthetase-like protein